MRFNDGAEPEKDWAAKHAVAGEKYGYVLAKISVRDAERTAMIQRLRTALAHFGGDSYSAEMTLDDRDG
ncbi:hypothetical protein [Microtetraspora niveoalba]|uniref:hypothetical protein n=1 Tax=Microtetraspora niveoalba TaxID=46175 RepID=UPI000A0027AD|nr:hypothetical protein [Microtetraspora niveoalba]